MRINHNIASLNTYRQLTNNNNAVSKSLEKLSSGLRINRAADDAAGLAISEKMRAQINGLEQAERNAQDGISLIQTAEGAMNETHSILQRMRELAVQASNDTYTDTDREELQKEIDQLIEEIDRIATTTEFNTQKLLDGSAAAAGTTTATAEIFSANTDNFTLATSTVANSVITDSDSYYIEIGDMATSTTFNYTVTTADGTESTGTVSAGGTISLASGVVVNVGADIEQFQAAGVNVTDEVTVTTEGSLTFQIGANSAQTMQVSVNDISASALNIDDVNVESQASAEATITAVEKALRDVSEERARLGAYQNRLEHTINNLGTASENLTASESRIRDVDMAREMMAFTKNNILTQAATSMLAQANQLPQGVLQLLR